MNHSISSGVAGVAWDQTKESWIAKICFAGENIHLGTHKNKRYAIELRKRAERKLRPLQQEQEKLIAKQLKKLKRELKQKAFTSLSAQIRSENAFAKQA